MRTRARFSEAQLAALMDFFKDCGWSLRNLSDGEVAAFCLEWKITKARSFPQLL